MIGLLTFQDTNNFGSYLQTYGLYKKVVDLGYDCEIIDYKCPALVRKEVPHLPKLRKNLYKYIVNWVTNPQRLKYQELQRFLHENAHVSEACNRNNIKKICDRYDNILVGSDMVWEMELQEGDLTYFLDFETNASKKIAFASSIGFPWKDGDKKKIKQFLTDFRHIAVREIQSADWVQDLIGKRPEVVCDPTMLLSIEEWRAYVNKEDVKGKYVLAYFEDDNNDCINTAIEYAHKHNLKVRRIEYGTSTPEYDVVYPKSINEFLSLIFNAELVVTASYHGMLFSLYFNRPLIYFLRRQTSRVDTLVEKLGIEICNGHNMSDRTQMPDMNYNKINEAIERYRNFSIACLSNMLAV